MTNPVLLAKCKDKTADSMQPDTGAALPPVRDARMLLFDQLKPYTSQLLRERDSPARLQGLLKKLQKVIRDADVDGLNSPGILDYVLFPLTPGIDSIVLMRRPGLCQCMAAGDLQHSCCVIHCLARDHGVLPSCFS